MTIRDDKLSLPEPKEWALDVETGEAVVSHALNP
jgi:hypothetical protein